MSRTHIFPAVRSFELILIVHATDSRVQVILLDIEGTTTPVDFVYAVLFPYARVHMREFLRRAHATPHVREDIERLREEYARDAGQRPAPPRWRDDSMESRLESAAAYLDWLMDRDRKSTALKSLQGKVWEAGYQSCELRGQVYPDVAPALTRWHRQGRDICIFSSGSVLAQKLLFAHSTAGDLTRLLRAYFDTATGPKQESQSYQRIAEGLGLRPQELLFVSDAVAELEAARRAGLEAALCLRSPAREGNTSAFPAVRTFDDIFP